MMNKTQIIKEVRILVGQAETKVALSKMLAFLDTDPQYRKLASLARLAQSKYERASRDLDIGTITNKEANLSFNLASRTLLKLTEDLEQHNLQPKGYEIQPSMFSKKLVQILTAITVLMSIGLGVWIYIEFFKSEPIVMVDGAECPVFDESSEFDILMLPFESAESSAVGAHTYIKRRIDELADQYGLNINIEIFKDYFEHNDSPGIKEASDIGKQCQAKLIIWGVSEETPQGKIVSTSFKYLGDENFKFTKLTIDDKVNNAVDTLESFSSIQTGGVLTAEIETIIYMVMGLVANRSHNYESAVAVLEEAESKGFSLRNSQIKGDTSTTGLLPDMILADSYIATHNPDKALMTYDSILEAHPNYGFALNNRAILNFQQKNYPEAIEDLEAQLDASPEDAKTWTIKARAHRALEQLDKADKYLDKAEKIAPLSPAIQKEKQMVDSLKVIKKEEKASATKEIRRNRKDIDSYNKRAAANYSLGEDAAAINDVQQVLKLDKSNPEAYAIWLETYQKEKDTANVKKILKEATRKGVDWKDVTRVRPLTGNIIKRNNKQKEHN